MDFHEAIIGGNFIEKNEKIIIKSILALLITIGIFFAIFSKIDFYSVANVLMHSNALYFIIAVLLSFFIVLLNIKRWQIILKIMDVSISYKEAFNIMMSVYPFVSITPSVASDTLRAYPLRKRVRASKIVGSVLTERVMDFSMLLIFLIVGIIIKKKSEFIFIALILFAGIVLIFYISHAKINLPLKQKWNDRFRNMLLSIKSLTMNRKGFLIVILYSISIWIFSLMQMSIIFYTIGINVPFFSVMTFTPLAIIIGQIPITLGGTGTRDAAFILLFSEYGTPNQLLGAAVLYSFLRLWLLSLIGIPFLSKAIQQSKRSKTSELI